MMYKEKRFCSATNDDLGIENDEKEKEEDKKNSTALRTVIKETLGDKVAEVVESKKLVSHPVCLTAKGGISFEMEKYFKRMNPDMPIPTERILELNPEHTAVKALQTAMAEDPLKAADYAKLLCAQAQLLADLPLEDPTAYTELVCKLMK